MTYQRPENSKLFGVVTTVDENPDRGSNVCDSRVLASSGRLNLAKKFIGQTQAVALPHGAQPCANGVMADRWPLSGAAEQHRLAVATEAP